jgi:adenylate kinase
LQTRLREYHGKTRPILDLFSRKELIVQVDGSRTTGEVQQEIRQRLGLRIPFEDLDEHLHSLWQ